MEAKIIEEKTGVSTIAAVDGMLINFGESINVQASRKTQKSLNKFF
jgi:hypothetical protein